METTIIGDISSNHLNDQDIRDSVDFLRSRGCLIKLQYYRPDYAPLAHLRDYALNHEIMREIASNDVFYTCFEPSMVDWMEKEINPAIYKIASRSYDDDNLLIRLLQTDKKIIQSVPIGKNLPRNNRIQYLHCVAEYPAKDPFLDRLRLGFSGFSDHTLDTKTAGEAVKRGAKIIEHHFAIRTMNTPDMCCSFISSQWDEMMENIKLGELNENS